MKILVSNVGSTSLKFKLFEMPQEQLLWEAKVERVGKEDAIYSWFCPTSGKKKTEICPVRTYSDGIRLFLQDCAGGAGVLGSVTELAAIGFKTVVAKGYAHVHELTEEVLVAMKEYLSVAPAHNGPYLEAIGWFRQLLPEVPLIGVFETAYHVTIPEARRIYPIPYEWYERYGIQRMGYHGASHSFIAGELTRQLGSTGKTVSCHLGGSSSLCAIDNGISVDNSFGFSPQAGVLHANRVGDIDPYIMPYLLEEGMPLEQILAGMAKNGGLQGISGVSNDLRQIQEAAGEGNTRAKLAIDAYVTSIIRYIGSYYAEMKGLDNLVFTGGIGENSSLIRAQVCEAISHMGITLDEKKNLAGGAEARVISAPESKVRVLVIPANEEIGIARHTYRKLTGA